jgi:hypothetical protein
MVPELSEHAALHKPQKGHWKVSNRNGLKKKKVWEVGEKDKGVYILYANNSQIGGTDTKSFHISRFHSNTFLLLSSHFFSQPLCFPCLVSVILTTLIRPTSKFKTTH